MNTKTENEIEVENASALEGITAESLGFAFKVHKERAFYSSAESETLFDSDMNPVIGYRESSMRQAESFCSIHAKGEVYQMPRKSYQPLQPAEWCNRMLDTVRKLEAAGSKIERVDARVIGARLFLDLTLDKKEIERKDRKLGDVVEWGIRISDTFDGSGGFKIEVFTKRLWCLNGCSHSFKELRINHRHTKNVLDYVDVSISRLQSMIGQIPKLQESYQTFALTPISEEKVNTVVDDLLGVLPEPTDPNEKSPNSTNLLNTRDQILSNVWRGLGQNVEGERTAFDVLNAFTEFDTHQRTVRGARSEEEKAESRFLGINGMKSATAYGPKAFEKLEEMLSIGELTIAV